MKKVLLVNTNTEKAPYPVPPLGLCMLATALKGLYEVKVYDGVFDEGRSLTDLVREFSPDYIGFSIRNIDDVVMARPKFYVDGILEKFIRPVKAMTGVPVILGGSGFSIFPAELMSVTGADWGIVGEAEEILPVLLDRIEHHLDTDDIPNLIRRNCTKVQAGSGFRGRGRIPSGFPEIDHWIDFNPYLGKGVYSIQTKRGCSHGCIYCTYPLIEGRKFRPRPAPEIADEIEQAHKRLGYITFEFVDSTFNDPAGHAEAICREIIRRNVRVRLRTMGMNPRHATGELFGLMLEAGFAQIDATPDSASPEMLKNLDKGFTLSEIENMARLIRKFNIPTMWFMLFGGPGENERTFKETLDFIDCFIDPRDMVYMNAGLRIYPNTPLFTIAAGEGKIPAGRSVFFPPAYYFSDKINQPDLEKLITKASQERNNCISSWESAPQPEMVSEALEMRKNMKLDEPMFRTLLAVRAKWKLAGKL